MSPASSVSPGCANRRINSFMVPSYPRGDSCCFREGVAKSTLKPIDLSNGFREKLRIIPILPRFSISETSLPAFAQASGSPRIRLRSRAGEESVLELPPAGHLLRRNDSRRGGSICVKQRATASVPVSRMDCYNNSKDKAKGVKKPVAGGQFSRRGRTRRRSALAAGTDWTLLPASGTRRTPRWGGSRWRRSVSVAPETIRRMASWFVAGKRVWKTARSQGPVNTRFRHEALPLPCAQVGHAGIA